MTSPDLAYFLVYALCSATAGAAALMVLQRRRVPAALPLGLTLLALCELTTCRLIELFPADVATKVLWSKIEYLGVVNIGPLLLISAARYAGYAGWLKRRSVALLWVVPTLVYLLTLTNEWHGLIWSSVTPDPTMPDGVVYAHGPAFWAGPFGYTYLLVGTATVLVVRTALEWHAVYLRRTILLLAAIAVPWLGTALYLLGVLPLNLDPTPVTLTICIALVALVVVRYRLLDLAPVPRGLLMEELGDGVLVVDQRGRVLDENPLACRMLGRGLAELLGGSLSILPAPWPAALSQAAAQPGQPLEVEFRPGGGKPVIVEGVSPRPPDTSWAEVCVAPLNGRNARQRGSLIVLRPITERKRSELALSKLNAELEERVAERTAALEQRSAELLAANARLTELHRLKSKFIADVSHELRTPLANLALYASLLERGKPEKQARYLAVLQQQVGLLSALVSEILEFGRLAEPGLRAISAPADLTLVDLNGLAAEVVEVQRPRAEGNGLELVWVPAAGLPRVQGDAGMLRRAIENLVVNALGYTAVGRVTVETAEAVGPLGVELRVRDTGPGIAPSDLPHIFERFYRGQGVGQSTQAGVGLGLAIVQEIVEAHGGTVGVETAVGCGTTFIVRLPAA